MVVVFVFLQSKLVSQLVVEFNVLSASKELPYILPKHTQCAVKTSKALLLMLSASIFPKPDFPLLLPVPTPLLSSASLHGMTFPFLSNRSHLWIPSNQTSRHCFFQNNRHAVFQLVLLSSFVSSLCLLSV